MCFTQSFNFDVTFNDILLLSNAEHTITRFTFPKAEHLKSRKAIEQLFKTGKSVLVRPYKVFYQIVEENSEQALGNEKTNTENAVSELPIVSSTELPIPLQAGFAVSSKNFKHAVDRNRVKRIGREVYRLNKQALINVLIVKKTQLQVFFVYTDKTLPNFDEAQQKMKMCLGKLISIIEKLDPK